MYLSLLLSMYLKSLDEVPTVAAAAVQYIHGLLTSFDGGHIYHLLSGVVDYIYIYGWCVSVSQPPAEVCLTDLAWDYSGPGEFIHSFTYIYTSTGICRDLPYGSGLGLSRCLGPGECLHSFYRYMHFNLRV